VAQGVGPEFKPQYCKKKKEKKELGRGGAHIPEREQLVEKSQDKGA
jgi:hypothetical protein